MDVSLELKAILSRVEKLDDNDKTTLIYKIRSFLHSKEKKKSLTQLKGLGAEIWKDVDIENYVEKEREW